jgi:Flp pilus assembly protein TadG
MKRGTRAKRGNIAIEYGLVLPMLLLFILGIMDVSRLVWTYTTLWRAAEAAARCGAINTAACATTTQVQNLAVSEAWGLSVAASDFTVTTPACGVQVQGTYDFNSIIPGFGVVAPMGLVTLQATACYPK